MKALLALLRPQRAAPLPYGWFSERELRAGFELGPPGPVAPVDDATWADLQIDRWLADVAADCSIFGRQWLYRRLRVAAPPEPLQAGFSAPPDAAWMQPLRRVEIEPSTPLHQPASFRPPRWVGWLWLLPLALLVALALGFFSLPAGVVLGIAAVLVSGWVQIRLHAGLQRWLQVRQMLITLLGAAVQLHRQAGADRAEAERLLMLFRRSFFESIPAAVEYANLFGLYEYRRQRHHVRLFEREQRALRAIFETVARQEALGCLVRHLQAQPVRCWAAPLDTGLRFEGLVSPLLAQPQGLDLELDRQGILLTGRNGVGKSTLLRSVGLNVLMAGAFGFCYAHSAACAPYRVLSSLQVVDAPERGLSTYLAELQRARQLLDASRSQAHTLVLVDELFSGTNPLESIAAGAAVLGTLCERSAVIVASHDPVLAPLLEGRLQPMCLQPRGPGQARLQLVPRLLADTNGISLLDELGFPPALVAQARSVRAWLGRQLLPPGVPPSPVPGPSGA